MHCLWLSRAFRTSTRSKEFAKASCARLNSHPNVALPWPPTSANAHTEEEDCDNGSNRNTVRLSILLSKYAPKLGLSRRSAERAIRSGDVKVSGQIVTSPMELIDHTRIMPGQVQFRGKAVNVNKKNDAAVGTFKVWAVHKLPGEIVTDSDPHDRPSMIQRLFRAGLGKINGGNSRLHLKPVGRLDMPTQGLILLTTDGQFARDLELPKNELHRVYKVRVHGKVTDDILRRMERGVTIDGTRYSPMRVVYKPSRRNGTNHWLEITCTEGKNRQIRVVLGHYGLTVTRLIRTSYGDYRLDSIPPGMAIAVPHKPVLQQKYRGKLFAPARNLANPVANETEKTPAVHWVRAHKNK